MAIDWLESKYGSLNFMTFLRSSLIVIDEAMTSNLPALTRAGSASNFCGGR